VGAASFYREISAQCTRISARFKPRSLRDKTASPTRLPTWHDLAADTSDRPVAGRTVSRRASFFQARRFY